MSNFAVVVLACIFILYTQGCNITTPIVVKAYDDGWINFTIPAQSVKKYGFEYTMHNEDNELLSGIRGFDLHRSQEQTFSSRVINGSSALGYVVDYELYRGDRIKKKCIVQGKPIVITELLSAESRDEPKTVA